MLVYGVRWGFGNLLGFAMGGIQWVGAPSRDPQAQNRDFRTHMQAVSAMDIPRSEKAWGDQSRNSSLPVNAPESPPNTYDFQGRPHKMLLESRGLLVDIRI